jgi:ribitol-5-phosphate 2-dehydrogenase (NADP+) / D-ribitol-5-phosphate cytidylyltransferase
MAKYKNVRAILLMGGSGDRFGSSRPKQFHFVAGKKLYLYVLEKFIDSVCFDEILLVAPSMWIQDVQEDVKKYKNAPPIRILAGGMTRQESSYLGVMACPTTTEIVVIHDAVRPFLTDRIIEENILKARDTGAADTCIASADTLVYAPDGDFIQNIPVRAHFLRGQTPQSFNYKYIYEAHLHAQTKKFEGISDDCRLVREMGRPVAVVQGDESNIKITTPLDLLLAEQILRQGGYEERDPPRRDLRGAKIAISGGTGGIGRAVANLLEKEGAIPIPLSRSSPYSVDFQCSMSIENCFKKLYEQFGALDGLINCVGHLKRASLQELSEESIDAQINLNFRGVVLACKHVCLKEGGQIINIASSSYSYGREEMAVYGASKAAIVNFSQGLAKERADWIINVVAPARTDTTMRRSQFPEENPELLLSAEKVAEEIIHLLRQARQYQTVIEIRKN